jgi:hypothetical protein
MIEMRMREKNVTNGVEVLEVEVTYSGARIDQDITVYQHRGSPRTRADTATTTKHANSHNEGSLEHVHMG